MKYIYWLRAACFRSFVWSYDGNLDRIVTQVDINGNHFILILLEGHLGILDTQIVLNKEK